MTKRMAAAAAGLCLGLAMVLVPALARTDEAAGAAVRKAIPLLEKGSAGYIRGRGCFSCHHQAVPVFALVAARDRGFAVDAKNLEAQVRHTEADLRGNIEAYRQGKGQGGGAVRAGYALWTMAAGGWKADDTTTAVSGFLLQRDASLGYWRTSANRPPSELSDFTAAFVALRALQAYGPADRAAELKTRTESVREWLLKTAAKDTEDRVFRLWSLKLAGAEAAEIATAARELLETQQPDGGWAQLPNMKSDAYATGSALVALREAAGLAPTEPAYRRGAAFLVATQLPDGSWHVVSRSKPFQPYFESGFPHGQDQWISSAATAWAVWALIAQ